MILASRSRQADHISNPLTLGAIPASSCTARTAARSLLIEWGLSDLTESVEQIVTELVTNAVKVSADYVVPPPVQFRMSATRGAVLIEVWDCDPRTPVIRQPASLDETGRGLLLVATMSTEWGWNEFGQGKIIWAEVR
jgi:anti-sigma regulatory factor (Ser/Thr protein kinase)